MPDTATLPPTPRAPALFELPAGCGVERAQFWLAAAKPGDRMVYHRGHLALDRKHLAGLGEIADFLQRASSRALVSLTQERGLAGAPHAYIAVKR